MPLLQEETTPKHPPSAIAKTVAICNSSATIFVSTAIEETIEATDPEDSSCPTISPSQVKYDVYSLYINLDDKPLPSLPVLTHVKEDDFDSVVRSDNHSNGFTTVSNDNQIQVALDNSLDAFRYSKNENVDENPTIDTPVPILVSSVELGDTPLSVNADKTDSPSITHATSCTLEQWLPPLSPSSQPSNDDGEALELLPLPATTPPPGRRAFDSLRGVSQWMERPFATEPFTIPTTKTSRAFDQASVATSASITSLRAATERITEYVAVAAHTTAEYLTTTVIPSTVDFAARSANTTTQYLCNPLSFSRLFNGSVDNQGSSSASSGDRSRDELEDPVRRERRIRREQRRLSRAYTNIHLEAMEFNCHARGNDHTNHRSPAPVLVYPRNVRSNGRAQSRVQEPQPPHAAFLGSRQSHTNTITSVASSTTSNLISDTMDSRSALAVSTITSTRSILPKQKRKRAPRSPLQTIPGPEGLDPDVRRELEAQDFAALRFRDGTAGRSWRNWWDPRRYGLPRYILFDEFRRPRLCTVILLVVVVTVIVLPIGLKNRD